MSHPRAHETRHFTSSKGSKLMRNRQSTTTITNHRESNVLWCFEFLNYTIHWEWNFPHFIHSVYIFLRYYNDACEIKLFNVIYTCLKIFKNIRLFFLYTYFSIFARKKISDIYRIIWIKISMKFLLSKSEISNHENFLYYSLLVSLISIFFYFFP